MAGTDEQTKDAGKTGTTGRDRLPMWRVGIAGVRRWRWRLAGVLAIAVVTYAALYGLTTWLGTFA